MRPVRLIFVIANLLGGIGLSACAGPSYVLSSTPVGANVFYSDPQTQKKFLMGTTPMSYSKSSLPGDGAFLMTFEKTGFLNMDIPIAPTDESRTMVNVTLRLDPSGTGQPNKEMNLSVARLFKAQSMIYRKRYQAAIVELDQLLKEKPDLVQAHVMKGTSYYLLNEMPSALSSWKKAMEIDPTNEELSRFLVDKNIKLQ